MRARPDLHNRDAPANEPRIAISAVEHSAVLDTCHALKAQGQIELVILPVDTGLLHFQESRGMLGFQVIERL